MVTVSGGMGGGSVGAYTMSQGIEVIRQHVAAYIEKRDGGIPASPDNVFLSGGASEAIRVPISLPVALGKKRRRGGGCRTS